MIMTALRLIRAYLRLNMQVIFAYRVNTVVDLITSLLWLGWELLSLSIIYSNTATIGGWVAGDLIALLGMWKVLMSVMFGMMWPNTEQFNKSVREGTLDYIFLLPANSQLLTSIQRLQVWQVHNLIQAAIMVPLGLSMAGRVANATEILMFLALAASGLVVLYSVWLVLISAVFWFTKFDNNITLMNALADSGRYPTGVYPTWLRLLVTFVIPIGLATTVPLQALRGELTLWQVLACLAGGAATFVVASAIWRAGTRRYAGASA